MTRGSTYAERLTAGVLPRCSATVATALTSARWRPARDSRHGLILGERGRRQDGGRPRPKILRRKFTAGRGLDVEVHVVGVHLDPPPALFVGEEVWAARSATPKSGDDLGCWRIADLECPLNRALRRIVENHHAIVNADVFFSEAGHAERLVFECVVLVPDAEISDVEQAHDRREHPLPAEVVLGHITAHVRPKLRQSRPEPLNSDELLSIPIPPPLVVVAILAAAGRVGADGLNVAVRPRADPYV